MGNIKSTKEFYNLCKAFSAEGKAEGVVHGDLQLMNLLAAYTPEDKNVISHALGDVVRFTTNSVSLLNKGITPEQLHDLCLLGLRCTEWGCLEYYYG